jgi:hypothetical protein
MLELAGFDPRKCGAAFRLMTEESSFMSRTVTALYDTRAEAEAARQRLGTALDLGSTRIVDQPSQLDKLHISAEARHVYGEGLRRGAFVLSAEVRGHEEADKIIRILEESPSMDLDSRQETWRREGWSSQAPVAPTHPAPAHPMGKREADRGGPRVRSYLRDLPSPEPVVERPHVESHPVHQPRVVPAHARADVQAPAPTFSAPDYQRPAPPAPPRQSGPSSAAVVRGVIAGAVAGGVIGGAIPFMLGGRETTARRREPRRDLAAEHRPLEGTVPAFEGVREPYRR